MPPHSPAHITLSASTTAGIVAVAHGEKYPWAETALQICGFHRRDDGAFALSGYSPKATRDTVRNLIRTAHRHQTSVTASRRPYLGDVAEEIAAHLPGTWSAETSIHSHPEWQYDLVPSLWDDGELLQAVQHQRAPYTAVLNNGEGINLLLVERPGHPGDYLVGAFASDGFDDNIDEPIAPRSIVLPGDHQLAAAAIAERFLPAYHQALHARRLDTVVYGLDTLREEYETLAAMKESGRYSDATLLDPDELPVLEEQFADMAHYKLRNYLIHAPDLLEQCRPEQTPWPEDAAALDRIQNAIAQWQNAFVEWRRFVPPGLLATASDEAKAQAKARRDARLRPVIETWLTDGETFLRQARAAAPAPPRPLPGPAPGAPALPPALPIPPGATPPRR
ncbi:hypothetical protein AB0L75_28325 [Streptomyces sp. NPDC052101]|uniref:hypothetical protein n=1 Tax=Streptomyces sp. NPDC052101 TaxID=3155763 RepID=UPI00342F2F3F